jgi:NAD(P)-dependent dehydrogenase (short-subunit alcohol dehydrogenase family)
MERVAIVTGGASGIGAALGAAMVRRGAHVVLADVDGEGAARKARRLCAAGPGTAAGVLVDVRDAEAVADLVARTSRERGRLDLMFNNAGVGIGGRPDELLLDHWNRSIDVNLRGVVHGCHAAYPVMKAQGGGHIVNTGSVEGLVAVGGRAAPYTTAKFGVVGLSLALRAAGARDGVRVHVVCPAYVDTPLLDRKGPADLPVPASVAKMPTLRELLAARGIRPYPPERLAEDVLRGVARDRAVIVAPFYARLLWAASRASPSAVPVAAHGLTRALGRLGGKRR